MLGAPKNIAGISRIFCTERKRGYSGLNPNLMKQGSLWLPANRLDAVVVIVPVSSAEDFRKCNMQGAEGENRVNRHKLSSPNLDGKPADSM